MQKKKKISILNLYCGIGGNRKLWGDKHEITAIENDPKIAKIYQDFFPEDNVIVADAHKYLENNFDEFDFIWSSPPCQSHSILAPNTSRNNKTGKLKRKTVFPDMKLYEEIIFLQHYCKKKWIVENVNPYYKPLINPIQQLGRHLIWCNFLFPQFNIKTPKGMMETGTIEDSEKLKEFFGLKYQGNIYCKGRHNPCQALRNCVHPEIGKRILEYAINPIETQKTLF